MKKYKNHIAASIAEKIDLEPFEIEMLIEMPRSEEMGDLAFPCFSLAKRLRKAPRAIAADLQSSIAPVDPVERIEANGPYLNFFFRHASLIGDVISEILDRGDDYGKSDLGAGKTVVVEYSAPNIAKPFGIGHLRSTVIGAALNRIYTHLGYDVVGINHLGDWGTQFGKLLYAYKQWGDESKLEADPISHLYDIYVKINQAEEKDPELVKATRAEFKKLEDGDPENTSLWKRFSDLSKDEFGKIYDMLGVKFDSDAGESFYIDKIPETEKKLRDAGLLSESREATIVDLEKFNMPPVLVRKSDDTTLYATRDLAAAIYRKKTYNFHKMIYVVGVAQSLYFRQLFKVLELMGFDWTSDCHHVSFGWIKLGDEMMSTRRGNIIFLDDVISKTVEKTKKIIEEGSSDLPNSEKTAFDVGVGAVVFADLAYKRDSDISFEWEKMLDFKGYTGPYLQYSHARICSVMRKYGRDVSSDSNAALLRLPEEYNLAKKLSLFPDIIIKASEEFEPQHIAFFLLELCGIFNTYYQKYRSPEDRILSSDEEIAKARVALAKCVNTVLRSGLNLLGLAAPEMM
ncbi:MAG: arginine--tRNA ligase [candidate division Zixibacteria bacterium]